MIMGVRDPVEIIKLDLPGGDFFLLCLLLFPPLFFSLKELYITKPLLKRFQS